MQREELAADLPKKSRMCHASQTDERYPEIFACVALRNRCRRHITGYLRALFPGVAVVGEEGLVGPAPDNAYAPPPLAVRTRGAGEALELCLRETDGTASRSLKFPGIQVVPQPLM